MATDMSEVSLLKYLSQSDIDVINEKIINIEKKPGEAIVLSGEPVSGVYWVKSGQVGVYPPGATNPFALLDQGSGFGELSFLDGGKASASIRVEMAGTQVGMVSHPVLHKLIKDFPSIGSCIYRGIAESLAQKLRLTNLKISAEISATRQTLESSTLPSGRDGIQEFIAAIERTIQF